MKNEPASFFATYKGGQHFEWGEQPQLIEHLEGLCSGLPIAPGWPAAPLLAEWREGRQILAWARAIPEEERGRAGAWEAWGIVGPSGWFRDWATFWSELEKPPQRGRLDGIAAQIAGQTRGRGLPHVPSTLADVLESLYLSEGPAYPVPLRDAEELPLLGWCHLLGPAQPDRATVGPPRRIPLASRHPFTYQGIFDESGLPMAESSVVHKIAAAAERGELAALRDILAELRFSSAAQRRQRLFPPKSKEREQQETPAMNMQTSPKPPPVPPQIEAMLKNIQLAMIASGLALVVVLFLAVGAFFYLRQIAGSMKNLEQTMDLLGTSAATQTLEPALDTTIGSTAGAEVLTSEAACREWWMRPAARAGVLSAVRTEVALRRIVLGGPAARAIAVSAPWVDATTPRVLTDAAVQMQLASEGCLTGTVDGNIGSGTLRAEETCRQRGRSILQGDAALQWLCTWSHP